MYVVVANRNDLAAQALVAHWTEQCGVDAALLTCADLSLVGWRHYLSQARDSTAVVAGRCIALSDVTGVLTRLSAVRVDELAHIVATDRVYVAQEMSAFLLSWLTTLRCPVLNPPTTTCLAGPGWRQTRWLHLAAQLGIPVQPFIQRAVWPDESTEPPTPPVPTAQRTRSVTVVGDRCFGAADAVMTEYALRLAGAAHSPFLAVHFCAEDHSLLGADLWPEIATPAIAEAILACLRRGRAC
jgi:hypothetical protein